MENLPATLISVMYFIHTLIYINLYIFTSIFTYLHPSLHIYIFTYVIGSVNKLTVLCVGRRSLSHTHMRGMEHPL